MGATRGVHGLRLLPLLVMPMVRRPLCQSQHGLMGLVLVLLLCGVSLMGCAADDSAAHEEPAEETSQPAVDPDSLEPPLGVQVMDISSEGIQIYWKRFEVADGYEVFRSYEEDGGYELIASLGKRSFMYTDSDFDRDRRAVYYRVRVVAQSGGDEVAGPFSDVITATYNDDLTLSCDRWYLADGDTYQFTTSHGWGEADDASWRSTDETVATIDGNGLLTAYASGTTTIICTSRKIGKRATAEVVVNRGPDAMLREPSPRYVPTGDNSWENPDATDSGDAVIMMGGDIMCMSKQQLTQHTEEGGYRFNESYDFLRPVLAQSDLAVANLETMVCPAYPYTSESNYLNGKPVCNAPTRILDAVSYAGIDALVMANNHNADMGVRGIPMTLEQVDRYQFAHTGLFASADDPRTMLIDVNGIKVGYAAYVGGGCPYNGQDRSWDQEQIDTMLNYYSKEKAAADLQELRDQGAEYLIVYMHWGNKNYYAIREKQVEVAQELADLGVDYIVGSHPHLIQCYEPIEASDGRTVPCIYSVGNFNSHINQVEGNLDTIIVRIRLRRTDEGIELAENAYIPCHIYLDYGSRSYVTMPLDESLNGGARTPRSQTYLARIAEQVGDALPRYEARS